MTTFYKYLKKMLNLSEFRFFHDLGVRIYIYIHVTHARRGTHLEATENCLRQSFKMRLRRENGASDSCNALE